MSICRVTGTSGAVERRRVARFWTAPRQRLGIGASERDFDARPSGTNSALTRSSSACHYVQRYEEMRLTAQDTSYVSRDGVTFIFIVVTWSRPTPTQSHAVDPVRGAGPISCATDSMRAAHVVPRECVMEGFAGSA